MECSTGDETRRADPAEFLSEECMLLVLSFLQPEKRSPLCSCCGLLYRKTESDPIVEATEDPAAGGETEEDATRVVDVGERGEAPHDLFADVDDGDEEEEDVASTGISHDNTSTDENVVDGEAADDDEDHDESDDNVTQGTDSVDAMDFYQGIASVSRRWKGLMDSSVKRFTPLVRFDPARIQGRQFSAESVLEWLGRHQLGIQSSFCEGQWTQAMIVALQKCDMSKLLGFHTIASISDLLAAVSPRKAFMEVLARDCFPKDLTSLIFHFGLILDSETRLPATLELPLFSHVSITTMVLELQMNGPNNDMLCPEILSPFIQNLPSLVELVLVSGSHNPGDNNEVIHIASDSLVRLHVESFWPCRRVRLSLACPSLQKFQCRGTFEPLLLPVLILSVEQAVARAEGVPESCVAVVVSPPCQACDECSGLPSLQLPFEALLNHVVAVME